MIVRIKILPNFAMFFDLILSLLLLFSNIKLIRFKLLIFRNADQHVVEIIFEKRLMSDFFFRKRRSAFSEYFTY